MNTQTQEALKMAIEALEGVDSELWSSRIKNAVDACKEALAQPAQEPVAWMAVDEISGEYMLEKEKDNGIEWTPLYTHPAPSWQGLSDGEILDKAAQIMVERHYKEKNKC